MKTFIVGHTWYDDHDNDRDHEDQTKAETPLKAVIATMLYIGIGEEVEAAIDGEECIFITVDADGKVYFQEAEDFLDNGEPGAWFRLEENWTFGGDEALMENDTYEWAFWTVREGAPEHECPTCGGKGTVPDAV